MKDDPMKSGTGAIDRTLAILALFASEQNSLDTREIIQMTGIPQSTCFRLLKHLVDAGFLQKYGKGYGLGDVMLRMAAHRSPPFDALRQTARPVMNGLSRKIHHSVGLNVLGRNNTRLCIELVHDPSQEIRQRIPMFTPLPMYKGASGKILWAYLPERVQQQIFHDHVDELGEDWNSVSLMLAAIRKQGYCCSRNERLPGASAVSVPIMDAQGRLLASLSVSIVTLPLVSEEDVNLYVVLLREASEEISERLSGKVQTGSTSV